MPFSQMPNLVMWYTLDMAVIDRTTSIQLACFGLAVSHRLSKIQKFIVKLVEGWLAAASKKTTTV